MISHRIELPKRWTDYLVTLPETGMGYQIVKVILTSGQVLRKIKVLNSSILLLENDPPLKEEDIEKIELE